MTVKPMKPFALSGPSAAVRLMRDNRGIAAIEFAMVVPLMLLMIFGVIEFSSGVAVNRKVSMMAQTLGDLASRYTSVSDTDFANFFAIGDAMMTPYPATHAGNPMQATITEIYLDPVSGNGRVQWSKGDAPKAAAPGGAVVTIPPDLIAKDATNKIIAGQYFILTEIGYLYKPAVGYVMAKAGVNLSDKSYLRPRVSTCVLYPPPPVGTNPPCPTN
jgi:Flp pilus assembly protein TadG